MAKYLKKLLLEYYGLKNIFLVYEKGIYGVQNLFSNSVLT